MSRVCEVAVVGPGATRVLDTVVVEEPFDLRVEGETFAVTLRTPGDDHDLAFGLLRAEAAIRTADDVLLLEHIAADPSGNTVDVRLAPGVPRPAAEGARARFANSACGVCGAASIERLARTHPRPRPRAPLDPSKLGHLPEAVAAAQPLFGRTGGLHGAALVGPEGQIRVVREDVGRHNAVDKVVGAGLRAAWDVEDDVLFVTSRVGYEIVEKAVVAGLAGIVALGAATSLAVELAARQRLPLVGFLRPTRATVYALSGEAPPTALHIDTARRHD